MAEVKGTKTFLEFKVTRVASELVQPAGPTPCECKKLSDANIQYVYGYHTPVILVYGNDEYTGGVAVRGKDPVVMIKEAVAKALVWYYPLAGRLREEKEERKVVVQCNGEGVMFVEADANFTLDDFGDTFFSSFTCLKELVCDIPGFSEILGCPLLLIQVTRLKCGGFILGLRLNSVMADATGLVQFLNAIAMLARGAKHPPVQPIWDHPAGDPVHVTRVHHQPEHLQTGADIPVDDHLVHKSFFFGPKEMTVVRCLVPLHMKSSTTFEVLTAYVWRSRTIALGLNPDETVRLTLSVDARTTFNPPLLPAGYYGNATAYTTVSTTAGELAGNSLGYSLELVKKAKASTVTEEYVKQGSGPKVSSFVVSDVSRVGFDRLDLGWGLPAYSGHGTNGFGVGSGFWSVNCMGESGILVPICLPSLAMDRFVKQLNELFVDLVNPKLSVISSSL